MSDLMRQSLQGALLPPPSPISPPDLDDHSSSDSSASSAASINTVRPSSREQAAPPDYWTNYFARELWLEHNDDTQHARYHVYLTPPSDPRKGPLFICHHGAGSTGMSFALFTQELRKLLPEAGVLILEARAHGSHVTDPTTHAPILNFSLTTLSADARAMISLAQAQLHWPALPPVVLVGHSLGAAIVTDLASTAALGASLLGYIAIDVVEGSALEALGHMQSYLSQRPRRFATLSDAVAWHLRTRTLRNPASAKASVPSLLIPDPADPGAWVWNTDLAHTVLWWPTWFTGMSGKFLAAPGGAAKMLILAGTDRLDKELMIGQMQGKFQLVVVPEAGHFVQEDVPEKTARMVAEFFRRNDRSAMILPPKVADMIAMGKKV